MKKNLLIISLTIFALTAVNAQDKISYGLKAGVNFSNMSSSYFVENDWKTGFHIGVLVEIPFGNKFSLQPEILYSTNYGTKGKMIMIGGPPRPIEYSLDYIQVPVLAKFYFFKNFSLDVGPSFNFLVKDEEIFNSITLSDIGSSFEFSGVLGVSYKTKVGFFCSLRYVQGLTVALDRDNYDEEAKNFGFQLGVGYMF